MSHAEDSDYLLSHVAVALANHEGWALRNGTTLPAGFLELARSVAFAARRGQARPTLDTPLPAVSAAPMTPLAVTYQQAGAALNVSERTVRRLVASGDLPTVQVGAGLVRVLATDLQVYLDKQRSTSTPSAPEAA